jgi:endonuclease/exonuclease/phosphatase family metal-dependent hydrolase
MQSLEWREAMRVRVATLNVWNTEGDHRRPDLINRELRRLNPDLIALQEVVQTPKARMLDRLLDGLDLQSTHQADIQSFVPPFAERYGGSALATRWPHRAVEALDLRVAGATDVPWATLAAVVQIPELGEMLFIAATAAWRPGAEAVREQQAIAISDLDARHRRDLPTVIAGDFNAAPDAASIRYLTGRQSLGGRSVLYHDAWAVAGDGPGTTWTSDNPNARAGADQIVRQPDYRRRFDYIFVGSWDAHPKGSALVQSARLAFDTPIDGVWASDHFGVVADLEIGIDG